METEVSSVVQAVSLISHMVWSWFRWKIFFLFTLLLKWFLYVMDAVICYVDWAVFKNRLMVLMISWFVFALFNLNHFFLVDAIIVSFVLSVSLLLHMVWTWLSWRTPFFSLCALWFQWFLHVMDAVISSFVWAVFKQVSMDSNGFFFVLCALWFQWCLHFKHAVISSVVLTVSLSSHMVWLWF